MKNRHMYFSILVLLPSLSFSSTTSETPLLSAQAVIGQIQADQGSTVTNLTPQAKFLVELKQYRQEKLKLSPQQAAQQWIGLYEKALAAQQTAQRGDLDAFDAVTQRPADVFSVLASLPGPSSWAELRKIASQKAKVSSHDSRKVAFRLLTEVLNHDEKAAEQSVKQIKELIPELPPTERDYASMLVTNVNHMLITQNGTPDQIVADVVNQLDQYVPSNTIQPFEIPDLMGLVGAAKATEVLHKAIHTNVPLHIANGDETKKLAREIALQQMPEARIPQWALADSVDASDLYEALDKHFPSKAGNSDTSADYQGSSGKHVASEYYLLHSILVGDQDKAESTLKLINSNSELSLPTDAIIALQKAHQNEALVAFLGKTLQKQPNIQGWDLYIEQSAHIGHANTALELIEAQLNRKDLVESTRQNLEQKHIAALLSANHVEDVISAMKERLRLAPSVEDKQLGARLKIATQLAGTGRLLNRPELAHQALSYIETALQLDTNELKYDRETIVSGAEKTYRLMQEPAKAQAIAINELKRKSITAENAEEYGIT